jgi:hypothetical protein
MGRQSSFANPVAGAFVCTYYGTLRRMQLYGPGTGNAYVYPIRFRYHPPDPVIFSVPG